MSVAVLFGLIAMVTISGLIAQGANSLALLSIFLASGIALYFFPSLNASRRSHMNATGIVLLNTFLGWTVLGWICALIWSYSAKKGDPESPFNRPIMDAPGRERNLPDYPDEKICPFCAETIKFAAMKCKHCGSTLEPTATPKTMTN